MRRLSPATISLRTALTAKEKSSSAKRLPPRTGLSQVDVHCKDVPTLWVRAHL